MPSMLFYGGTLYARDGVLSPGWLRTEGNRIQALGADDPPPAGDALAIDLAGHALAPGLIDLHAHGALGMDTMDATPEALRAIAAFYARHGVTGFLPTTVTAPHADVLAALRNVARAMREGTRGATVLGAHVEGPWLDASRLGAQDGRYVRAPSLDELRDMLETGVVRLLTLAPELPGTSAVVDSALERGVVLAAGHTRATWEEMVAAAERGVRHVTHLFNGMEPLHHRQPGVVGAALTLSAVTCQLIADNIHVHPAVLNLAWRAKGTDGIALVTDAMRGAGMPDGIYTLGGLEVHVQNGVARLPAGNLAGSTLTMERAVVNMMAATGLPLVEALRMATVVPARVLGLGGHKGCLAPGYDADLVVLDGQCRVCQTVIGGDVLYSAEDHVRRSP